MDSFKKPEPLLRFFLSAARIVSPLRDLETKPVIKSAILVSNIIKYSKKYLAFSVKAWYSAVVESVSYGVDPKVRSFCWAFFTP